MSKWNTLKLRQSVSFCAMMTIVMAAGSAVAEEVWVYNWEEYIDYDLLEKFEEETGIDVIYDEFDTADTLESSLLEGNIRYDVIIPSDILLERQIGSGSLLALDKTKLPNADNQWDVILDLTDQYDPGHVYSINYMWGTTGLGVNEEMVAEILGDDAPIDSLSLIFDPIYMEQLAECGVIFVDDSAEVIAAALQYLGEDPNSKDPEVLNLVVPVLDAVRPYLRDFDSTYYSEQLSNAEVCVAFGYSGDMLLAAELAEELESGVEITYIVPSEGAVIWFDQMAIPADAPNPDAAHTFINFMLDAENMAAATNYVYFANGNLASQEWLDEEVLEDPAIYPDKAIIEKLFTVSAYEIREQRLITGIWNNFKGQN